MASIKNYVTPNQLYRYRSLENFEREIEVIERGYLFCAAYQKLNDPMEGRFASSGRLRRNSAEHRAVREAVIENKAQIGMCSFSEVYDHELMWAHYADRFRGICVSYNLGQLLKNLGGGYEFVRMYYNEVEPKITSDTEAPRLAKKVLSCKSYRWLYEREWRMFGRLGKAQYHKIDCVSRVYLGFRIGTNNRRLIKDKLDRLGIETWSMSINRYAMEFEQDT